MAFCPSWFKVFSNKTEPPAQALTREELGAKHQQQQLGAGTCFSITKPIQGSLKDSDFIADRVFLEIAHKLLVTKGTATAATVAIVKSDITQSLPG